MNAPHSTTWLTLVRQAAGNWLPEKPPTRPPATATDIAALEERAARLGLALDPSYVDFLTQSNGFSYDGFLVFDAGRDADFVRMNEGLEWREPAETVFASRDGLYLVRSAHGSFVMIDGGSGNPMSGSCGSFIEMFSKELASMLSVNLSD